MGLGVPLFVVLVVDGVVGPLVEGVFPVRTLCPLVLVRGCVVPSVVRR